MLVVLTPEQAKEAHEKKRAHFAEVLRSTLTLFPNTDPQALITFVLKLGTDHGLITKDDIEWVQKIAAESKRDPS